MSTFLKIYGLIVLLALIAAVADRLLFKKKKNIILKTCIYSGMFYWVISVVRTLSGSGYDYVSYTFFGKELQGYVKVLILLLAVYVFNTVIGHFLREKYESFIRLWAGYYAAAGSTYIILASQLRMRIGALIGIVAAIAALISVALKLKVEVADKKMRYILTASQLLLFTVLYYIVGPLELYAYNSDDFLYGLGDFFPLLLAGAILFVLVGTVLITELLPEAVYKIYIMLVCGYSVIGYVQAFLLNGKMTSLDGSEQVWSTGKLVANGIIWLILVLLIILLAYKAKNWKKVFIGIAAYIVVIQLSTLVYIFLTTDAAGARTMQITEKDSFTVSADENLVVFLLDAYDVQFIDKVVESDPAYLSPLKDFTYYNNMESRYYYTDFSLPYLLTAPVDKELNVTDKSETEAWYDGSQFLERIHNYDYDINILTERKYIKNIKDGLVSNYTDEGYCVLDAEKTMEIFSNCMRYKNMPFALKDMYRYEMFDLENALADTNIYRMGTDYLIDRHVKEEGLELTDDYKAFRFYHLYGAHAPYYVTENNEMDYNSCNPLAQFKGCLLTVYDYIDALKKEGIYDNTTIIIMADHGLNPGQVDALKSAGETCNEDKSNPIFFIKGKNAVRDEMAVESKATSHDMYFDTLMKCIDPSLGNDYFGNIWE